MEKREVYKLDKIGKMYIRNQCCHYFEKKNYERAADHLPALLPHIEHCLCNQLLQAFLLWGMRTQEMEHSRGDFYIASAVYFWPRILRDLVNLTWWFSFFDSSSILCTGSGDGESDIPAGPHHAVYQCFRYSVYCQNFFSFWGYVLWTVVFRTRIILLRERENVQGLSA